MARHYRADQATSNTGSTIAFVVVDEHYDFHTEACAYLAHLRTAGRSPNTERVYSSRIALFLNYCEHQRLDWQRLSFDDLARFLNHVSTQPITQNGNQPQRLRFRSNSTANAIMTTVTEFLRYSSARGWVDDSLVKSLTRPKYLRFRAPSHDWGEDEQYRTVSERLLKLPESGSAIQVLSNEDSSKLVNAATNPRDKFLVCLMLETGVRIGEALGLRRYDMHLLASSSRLGCPVVGPHIHIRRRQNSNGSLAKSRYPRAIPITSATVQLYALYQHERSLCRPAEDSDFVFVNLYKSPLGEPTKYSNAKKLFDRMSANAGIVARPHMLRHSAATRWVSEGAPRDVVQALLGHVSPASVEVYLHPTDSEMRAAVERTGTST